MTDTVLEIQNANQSLKLEDIKIVKNFGQRLREAAGKSYKQEKLPNGDIKITMVIPANKQEVKNG